MYPKLFLAGLSLAVLAGCASKPMTYEPDHSRAYNLAQAAGLWKAQDFDIPKDQGETLTSAAFEITGDAAMFNSQLGLGLATDAAVGLSVLSFLFSPPSQLDRDAVLAWVPSTQASDAEDAVSFVSSALFDASVAVFEEEGLSYEVNYRDNKRHALFDPYYETWISFTSEGHNCGVGYQFFPREVSDEMAFPDFILSGTTGYRFWAPHEIRYPKFDIGCRDAPPTIGLAMASRISEKLPEGVFLYMKSRAGADRSTRTPPMILDHGTPLLFLTPSS